MSDVTQLPDLMPALPEIILAIGAMVLLMVGAFGGRNISYAVFGGAMGLLGGTFLVLLLVPSFGETFGGSFILDDYAYFLKLVVLVGSFFAIAMSWAYAKSQSFDHFEYPILIVLATLGMMLMLSANDMIALYMGLELQSLVALCCGGDQPRQRQVNGSGLEVFRSRCAVLRHAAIWHVAGLRLHRSDFLRRNCRVDFARRRVNRSDHRLDLHSCRPRLQDFRRAVPHVDTGRL
jgi:hypothetical protein